jgi:hypothetical protein
MRRLWTAGVVLSLTGVAHDRQTGTTNAAGDVFASQNPLSR